jgi:hypothetical protein
MTAAMLAQDDAVRAFLEGPVDSHLAQALAKEPASALLALVQRLAAEGRRAHLEALGEARVPKEVAKAARKAAYKLKSKGVPGEATRGPGIDLRALVDLGDAALISGPGLRGRYGLVVRDLGGAGGVQVEADDGRILEIHSLEEVSVARLRKVAAEERLRGGASLPVLAHASLVVRFLDQVETEVLARGTELPPAWTHVDAWRSAATRHGAEPGAASARAVLGSELAGIDINLQRTTHLLLEVAEVGIGLPPGPVLEGLVGQVELAVHSTLEVTRPQFEERLHGMTTSALESWLSTPLERRLVAGRLETGADLLLAVGKRQEALQACWVSAQLGDPERPLRDVALLDRAFRGILSVDACWEHYQAHLRGEDVHEDVAGGGH